MGLVFEGWRSGGRLRPLTAAATAILALALGRACFIGIADPRAVGDDAGSGGDGGTAGTSAGVGASAGEAGVECDAGQIRCGNQCESVDDPDFGCGAASCTPCDEPDAGSTLEAVCIQGACGLCIRCGDQCYGPVADLPSPASTDAGPVAAIPSLSTAPLIDGNIADWPDAVPVVPIKGVCEGCTDPARPGGRDGPQIVNFKQVPQPTELDAYFRVGWNIASLYVFAIVRDDEIYAPSSDADGGPISADQVDGLELFIDGDAVPEGFGPAAHHLFLGLNLALAAPNNSLPVQQTQIGVAARRMESCYFIETRLDWTYLRQFLGTTGSGTLLRLSVGVNDWDTDGAPSREYQVVWRDPGFNYANETHGYPLVILE
jgi:hypothetical protein